MTFITRIIGRSFTTSNNLNGLKKISPAALWHAKVLGIDFNEIVGSGPKGHILKSDILSFNLKEKNKQQDSNNLVNDISLIFEIIPSTNEIIIQKCIKRITSDKFKDVQYKFIPEIGFLQVQMKGTGTIIDGERIKNLLKMYLNDSRHLLL